MKAAVKHFLPFILLHPQYTKKKKKQRELGLVTGVMWNKAGSITRLTPPDRHAQLKHASGRIAMIDVGHRRTPVLISLQQQNWSTIQI